MIDINLINDDCLNAMQDIPDKSIDMILCDLPYGTTACKWDSIIPTISLWEQYKRIIKPTGIIALFGSQPFSSTLISSNYDWFKYELIWEKCRASGHLHAKNKPLKSHENILIFSGGTTVHASQSKNRATYNPQLTDGYPSKRTFNKANTGKLNHEPSKSNLEFIGKEIINEGVRYPRSVIKCSFHNVGNLHPTQKPTELLEYLIKTYTNENELVLDNTMGSGSTGVACINTNRNFIGIEKDLNYFNIAKDRIESENNKINLDDLF